MKTKSVTRTEICEAFIEDADRVTDLMMALKSYCNHVITEEKYKEEIREYRGDGANDPDNQPTNRFKRVPVSKVVYDEVLMPAERRAEQNHLIRLPDVAASISGTIRVSESGYPSHTKPEKKHHKHDECPDCDGDCEHCEYSMNSEELFRRFGVTPEFIEFLINLR